VLAQWSVVTMKNCDVDPESRRNKCDFSMKNATLTMTSYVLKNGISAKILEIFSMGFRVDFTNQSDLKGV
jgi:hypothetical protein